MSTPGDLGFLRAAILEQLNCHPRPLNLPADHIEREWLEWLEVPMQTGPAPNLKIEPIDLNGKELREGGILPEVIYSCLVQTFWHPGQADWVARTRSEIRACFSAQELERPGWALTREAIERVNAYRLQELTPQELLEASRPFWRDHCDETERMEGWILLHLESFRRLQDVADCLYPFLHHGPAPPGADVRVTLRVPEGLEWEDAVQMLGEERVRRWIGQ